LVVVVFWISILFCNVYIAYKTPVKNLMEGKIKYWPTKILQVLCIFFSTVCPFVSVMLLFQDADIAIKMRHNKENHEKACKIKEKIKREKKKTKLEEAVSLCLMKLDGERRQLLASRSRLSKDFAANNHWQLIMGSCLQLLTLCILTIAFAKAPTIDILRILFTLIGWTWRRWSRYILKKEDPVSKMGKAMIGSRILLENFNCLCTLFLFANPCFGLNQPNASVYNTSVYIPVCIAFSLIHFFSVIFFNVDIPEKRFGPFKYSGHKGIGGIGWGQVLGKAVWNMFFPAVGRDWDEPQGQYATDDSRKTSEEIQRDWKHKLREYSVVSGLYCIRNIVFLYPALECFCLHGQYAYAILALPVVLLFFCLLQIWLFKQYNEEKHPWKRLLKNKQESNKPKKKRESIIDSMTLHDKFKYLYSAGTARFSDLYHQMEAKKLRQSKIMEIESMREGREELVPPKEEEQIQLEIEIAEEDRREKQRNMSISEYRILVREYAAEVGKTDREVVIEIIWHVVENARPLFQQVTEAEIDKIGLTWPSIPSFLLQSLKEKIRETAEIPSS